MSELEVEERPDPSSRRANLLSWGIGVVVGIFLASWLAMIILLGGSDSEPGPAPDVATTTPGAAIETVTVTATEFAFAVEPTEVPAGDVEFVLRNDGVVFHNLEIVGPDGELVPGLLLEAEAGQEDGGSVQLDSASYLLICSVPGHREAGMEAPFTVAP